MRETGKLAFEYEAEAQKVTIAQRIAAGKAGKPLTYSSAAGPLAADYQALTDDILATYVHALQGATP